MGQYTFHISMAWVGEVIEGEVQLLKRRNGGLVRRLEIFFGEIFTCDARARAMRVHRSVLRTRTGESRARARGVGGLRWESG